MIKIFTFLYLIFISSLYGESFSEKLEMDYKRSKSCYLFLPSDHLLLGLKGTLGGDISKLLILKDLSNNNPMLIFIYGPLKDRHTIYYLKKGEISDGEKESVKFLDFVKRSKIVIPKGIKISELISNVRDR